MIGPSFCKECGGHHWGACDLVLTAHGTMCRPELAKGCEKRHADARSTVDYTPKPPVISHDRTAVSA